MPNKRIMVTEPSWYIVKPFDERDLLVAVETGLFKHAATDKRE